MLSKENIEDLFGLAPMQMGMLLHQARNPDTTAYIEQFDFVMAGSVDEAALQRAFALVVQKYSALRTIFSYRKTDTPKQLVLRKREATIDVVRTEGADEALRQHEVESFKIADKERGFDLSKDMLVRMSLLTRSDQKSHVIFTFHHIILDGWCLGLVFGDLFRFYDAIINKQLGGDAVAQSKLFREQHGYAEFIRWLESRDRDAARRWWQALLVDYETPVGLPYFDMPEVSAPPLPQVYRFSLGKALSGQLQQVAQKHKLTFNALFQTAWGVLLQKFNNTRDVIFGTVVSGRPPQLAGVQEMVGLFINTLPLRIKSDADADFLMLAKQVGEQIFDASAYDYFPLYEIQQLSELKGRLINHVVAFENYPIADQMRALSAEADTLSVLDVLVEEQTNYDFNLTVNPGEDVHVTFSYNSVKFSVDIMELLERSLRTLLEAIAKAPEAHIDSLSICSEVDRLRIIDEFNDTVTQYPREVSITELFIQTAAAHSDKIALSSADRKLTYAELKNQVMQVGASLQQRGVQSGARIAVFLPRSPEVLVAILGCLSAGATYVPLDIDTPMSRLEFILEDADVSRVITSIGQDLPPLPNIESLQIEELCAGIDHTSDFVPADLTADAAACVMYTSGSTGKPKGCCVSHRNIVRLVKNTNYIQFDEHQVILSASSPVFDASTFEYWGALLNGSRLCLYDNSYLLDSEKLKTLLLTESVTTMLLTSALFNQLVDTDISLFSPLQQLVVGGEVLSLTATGKLIESHPNIVLVNAYGPTENGTISSTYRIRQAERYRLPIGKPIANSSCYMVDVGGQLLPPGAYGELCVGGDGVSAGYLKRDEVNAQVFLQNPFAEGRLYRTGDIARWLPDGNIDLLGRKDFQHKIRGYRVELGEIETVINAIAGVSNSLVQVRDSAGAGKQLHAWFVSDSASVDEKQVRLTLLKDLPRYMVPDHLLRLEKFPLNISGKIDRQALPEIALSSAKRDDLVLPGNEQQTLISDICREVLGIDQLSIYDSFFEMGANSINLITINNRLKKSLDREIPITAMFEHTSVYKLSEYLNPDVAAMEEAEKEVQTALKDARANLMKSRKLKRMDEAV